ncbi:hypothetical protein PHPALM_30693 [Phytophthora palmivora]|uniref:Uncharacterized protein n=1 Tax=Phytophthora palmivora TaxID=4796 RepID=A0A2P4X4I7_9STRA|nr:hypothetical protein PHPALM_30693 [Phytophthora palmivora]
MVCSPLSAVEKKDIDPTIKVRLIHDLSFSENLSTKASFDKSPHYIITIADRIEDLVARYPQFVPQILKGDVKGAYRHLIVASQHVAFGCAITWVERENSPSTVSICDDSEPFWGVVWVDDHLFIEVDKTILGPRAINEEKFSHWETRLTALGLSWDTDNSTVSIPDDKIAKALDRVTKLNQSQTVTKSDLLKLLGSLRHICSFLRTARPFYQRLQYACKRTPQHGVVKHENNF